MIYLEYISNIIFQKTKIFLDYILIIIILDIIEANSNIKERVSVYTK